MWTNFFHTTQLKELANCDNTLTATFCSTVLVTEWLLLAQCSAVSDYVRFDITDLQVARCQVARAVWYRRYSQYLRRLTIYFTATIYRGISWLWRYWYRHLSIDDKYRGIAGIAQHYIQVHTRFSRELENLQQSKLTSFSESRCLASFERNELKTELVKFVAQDLWPFSVVWRWICFFCASR